MQDTIGEVIVAIPKPRGEGAWAWCRYWLIRAKRHANGEQFDCRITGCPYGPPQLLGFPTSTFCELHMPAEERERREKRRATFRAQFERRKAAGEIPRRTFCQWLGINRPLR